jgi:hypothetical protein
MAVDHPHPHLETGALLVAVDDDLGVAVGAERAAPRAGMRLGRRAGRHVDELVVWKAGVGDDAAIGAPVVVHDLVSELEEPALLDVGVFLRVERVADLHLPARADLSERVREVQPLEAAVLQEFAGHLRAADRSQVAVQLGGAERLVGAAELSERPVDAGRLRHHFAQHALRDADLRPLAVGRSLRVDEVVHVRRQVIAIRELRGHRARGVEDHEHVRLRAHVRLEELAVVRAGRRRRREEDREKDREANALPRDHSSQPPQGSSADCLPFSVHCSLFT